MKSPVARFARLFMAAVLLAVATVQPALAQGDSDAGPQVLRDTETELLFKDLSRPLIVAGGLDPHSVNVVLLNDPEINAFVSQGQTELSPEEKSQYSHRGAALRQFLDWYEKQFPR